MMSNSTEVLINSRTTLQSYQEPGDASSSEDQPKTVDTTDSLSEDPPKTDDVNDSPSEDQPKTVDTTDSPSVDPPKAADTDDSTTVGPQKTDNATDSSSVDPPKAVDANDSPTVGPQKTDNAVDSPSVDPPKAVDANVCTSEDQPKTVDTTDSLSVDPPKKGDANESTSEDQLKTVDTKGSSSEDLPKTVDANDSPSEDQTKTVDTTDSPSVDPSKAADTDDSTTVGPQKTDNATDSSSVDPPKAVDANDSPTVGPQKTDNAVDSPSVDPPKAVDANVSTSEDQPKTVDTTDSLSVDPPKKGDANDSTSEDQLKTVDTKGSSSEDLPKTVDANDSPSEDQTKTVDTTDSPSVDPPNTVDANDRPPVGPQKTDNATESPSVDPPKTVDANDSPSEDQTKKVNTKDIPSVDPPIAADANDSPTVGPQKTDNAVESPSEDPPKTVDANDKPSENQPKTVDTTDSPSVDPPKAADANDSPTVGPQKTDNAVESSSEDPPKAVDTNESTSEDQPKTVDTTDSLSVDPLKTVDANDSPSEDQPKTVDTTDSPSEDPPKKGDANDSTSEDQLKTVDTKGSSSVDPPKTVDANDSRTVGPQKTDNATDSPSEHPPKTVDANDSPSEDQTKTVDTTDSSSVDPPKTVDADDSPTVGPQKTDNATDSPSGSEKAENSDNIRPQTWISSAKGVKNRQKLSAEQLMGRLHLEGKYQKLNTASFLQITEHSQSHEFCAEEEIAQTFLQKLLTLDYTVRCIKIGENNEQNDRQQRCNKLSKRDVFDDIFGDAAESADETNILDAIDLMDAQMAVFHCADSFLKQLIVTKLSQCQFALPLLVPNPFTQQIEFPLWTFRQTKKSWKTTDDKGQTQPVYRAETPMVAFFRFGSVSSSKSQLINSLINEKHNTFFHRNCPGSSRTRILMDGVVEIAWYCPSGDKTDTFPQCVAFCNLHGDGGDNEKQLDIITQMSCVNVVILPQITKNDNSMTKIEKLYQGSKPLICLLTENDSTLKEVKQGKYRIGLRDRNQSTVFEELRKAINKEFSSLESSSLFKLEDVAKHLNITVDEKTDEDCRSGKDAAQKMMSLLESKDLTEIKESFLPCQGQLWHQWCQMNKELHRPTLGELHKSDIIEKNKSYEKLEMLKIREQQQTSGLSKFIQIFIQQLNSQEGNEMVYFLKWLGILLDDFTTESFSALHHEYNEKWSAVSDLRKKHDKSQQLKAEPELERISEKLQAATIGLEHILREVGQIYESWSSVINNKKNLKIDFRTLPGLAAKMMMTGFPLELMDGDAAHVPLIWVTAVLDELIKKLGDKRVFVLSVLGIQSSGKSTMLNAMFGLQFAVSAGRCTRGAFMQLVKVSDEMKIKEQLKFDYILVVDTEGLRALELAGRSTRNHDNELATFVVGLGNITLINIFGENTAEMQDTLQIVVQAFLRMKKIKVNSSCMFVHQNVSDVTAREKNMEGRRRQQNNLDEMTKLVAKEEDCNTECFSDVIAFDVQNDVKYFSQLWEGSPPMAPPNPNYSRNVQELKNIILSKASRGSGITLSQFKMRIDDIWTALLNENFVFSFKNTLEISVYRKLETNYSNWIFSLRSAMLRIENKICNRIANGNIENHDHDLLAEMRKTKEEVEKSMKSYFDEDKDKDILCQWRERFESQIKGLYDDLVKEIKRKLNKAIEQKKARENLDKRRTEYEKMLFTRSKELAVSLKSKGGDERVLKKEFDTVWSKWITELTEDIPPLKDSDLWENVIQVLSENHEPTFVNQRLNLQCFKHIVHRGDYDDYIILQRHLEQSDETVSTQNETLNVEYNDSVRQLIHTVKQETKKISEKSPVKRHGYNFSYIQEITDCVKKLVEQHESENQTYKLKREFITDLCLYVCDTASTKILKLHKKFREANDPKMQKTQYYNIFMNYYRGATNTTTIIHFICSKLEPSILQEVYNQTAIDLAAQMKSDTRALRENRSNLEKHILKSLAEKEDFQQYIQYILIPKQHFKQFIKTEVDKYFNEQSEIILNIFKGNLQQKEQIVSNAVRAVTVEVKNKGGDGNMWFTSFTKTLTDELKFTGEPCVNLTEVKDLDFLENHFRKSLNEMTKNLQNSFSRINDIKMEKCKKKPDEILIDHFCQCCWVQCPFCKAICTNTMEDHSGDHSVPFHRSIGLNGRFYRETTNLANCFCTTEVTTDNWLYAENSDEKIFWREYRKGGPELANWSITPDLSELPYWKWVVCRFQEDLEKYYSKTFKAHFEIPDEWRQYTKEDAIESLDKYY
ncbi:interferon-induced very large GTPase 1-like [Triplophysa dalaica]|uniref:interferon-induced very large GTPase 1-like n=1 Tax=Triplophysa dalaica TaxID=1582913 RepID=UPI0024DF498B|nr:interferon-induced very large GTPase 1-like [Triplophysa dalaica]XP_056600444.1 interferon-induced very large GTPase 1-like [Triplophysa dalaica]XP_056600445.1 interferon-induced very large GTPase 1-like [Triplophysa dalaica]